MGVSIRSVLVAVIACGCGGSAAKPTDISSSATLVSLSPSQIDELCAYTIDVEGGPHTVTCSGGSTVTIPDEAGCASGFGGLPTSCAATVGDAEACAEAVGADPCGLGGSACAPLAACATSG